jgi:hypothetical protein
VESYGVPGKMVKHNVSTMTRNKIGINLAVFLSLGVFTWAGEIDPGSWLPKAHEDALERGPVSNPGDFGGIPLNESGRARALAYSPSEISMPEGACEFYTPWHFMVGPWGLKIWSETDHLTNGKSRSLGNRRMGNPRSYDDWEGRAHPSKNAPHSPSGFTTGSWDGQILTTTHMRTGQARRGGAALSDEAAMTIASYTSWRYPGAGSLCRGPPCLFNPAVLALEVLCAVSRIHYP